MNILGLINEYTNIYINIYLYINEYTGFNKIHHSG